MNKLYLALLLAILYVLLSLPLVYETTNKFMGHSMMITYPNCPGLPTLTGTLAHGTVFLVLAYILLRMKDEWVVAAVARPIKIEKPTQSDS